MDVRWRRCPPVVGDGRDRGRPVNVSIGYIAPTLRLSLASKPEMRDGGSFYGLTVHGTTAKGDAFSVSVYSEQPIQVEGDLSTPPAQGDLPWDL